MRAGFHCRPALVTLHPTLCSTPAPQAHGRRMHACLAHLPRQPCRPRHRLGQQPPTPRAAAAAAHLARHFAFKSVTLLHHQRHAPRLLRQRHGAHDGKGHAAGPQLVLGWGWGAGKKGRVGMWAAVVACLSEGQVCASQPGTHHPVPQPAFLASVHRLHGMPAALPSCRHAPQPGPGCPPHPSACSPGCRPASCSCAPPAAPSQCRCPAGRGA